MIRGMAGKLSFGFASAGLLWMLAMLAYLPSTFLPGDDDLVPVVIPVVLAAGAYLALQRTCHGHRGRSVAWTCAGLLYAYCVISGFSIGLLLMPGAVALLLATAIVPTPR